MVEDDRGLDGLLELIQSIDLEQAVKERAKLDDAIASKQAEMTPMDRLVEELKKGRTISRKKKRPKMHYKVRRRKRREWYARVEAPRRKKRVALMLEEGATGWYKYLRKQWQQQKIKVLLTEEEFTGTIWPFIEGRVFTVRRYVPKNGISLDNIWIEDVDTGETLFCGKEHRLRELGAII